MLQSAASGGTDRRRAPAQGSWLASRGLLIFPTISDFRRSGASSGFHVAEPSIGAQSAALPEERGRGVSRPVRSGGSDWLGSRLANHPHWLRANRPPVPSRKMEAARARSSGQSPPLHPWVYPGGDCSRDRPIQDRIAHSPVCIRSLSDQRVCRSSPVHIRRSGPAERISISLAES